MSPLDEAAVQGGFLLSDKSSTKEDKPGGKGPRKRSREAVASGTEATARCNTSLNQQAGEVAPQQEEATREGSAKKMAGAQDAMGADLWLRQDSRRAARAYLSDHLGLTIDATVRKTCTLAKQHCNSSNLGCAAFTTISGT
jgi:hypothetical protein